MYNQLFRVGNVFQVTMFIIRIVTESATLYLL